MPIVSVKNISLKFKMEQNRANSLKEFCVRWLKRDLKSEDFWALTDVSFDVEKGDVIGIMKPTKGTIEAYGNIVPMLELGSGFDMELSGRENIYLNGAILGYSEEFLNEKYDEIVTFSELGNFIEAPLRTYSSGMLARLAFSVACIVEPEILIVDEILSVGDADFQEKSRARMMDLMTGGTTVFFVSHSLKQIREMCNKVVWLEHGKIQAIGKTEEICNMYEGAKHERYKNPCCNA